MSITMLKTIIVTGQFSIHGLSRGLLRCKSTFPEITEQFLEKIPTYPLHSPKSTKEQQKLDSSIPKVPTVGSIMNKTVTAQSSAILAKWREKKIGELGVIGFSKYVKDITAVGSSLHFLVAQYLENPAKKHVIPENLVNHMRSIEPVLDEVESVMLLETMVQHPDLFYRGRLDGVLVFANTPMIVEWKTVHEMRRVTTLSSTYDSPIQLAAYLGAFSRCYPDVPKVTTGLLVYAYPDGSPADVIPMTSDEMEHYWKLWKEKLLQFYTMQRQAVSPTFASASTSFVSDESKVKRSKGVVEDDVDSRKLPKKTKKIDIAE